MFAAKLVSGHTELSFNIVESPYFLGEGSLESRDIGVKLSLPSAEAPVRKSVYIHL
jgi:hypothetical protein